MNTLLALLSPQRSWSILGLRVAFLAAVTVLAIGSLLPIDYASGHSHNDKVLHIVGYGIVSGLALLAIRSPRRQVACLLMLTTLGVALEFGQILVPGRTFELGDMVANGCGIFVAFHASRLVVFLMQRQRTIGARPTEGRHEECIRRF